MVDSITWKIGGEAGFGIMSSGIMLSKIYARSGYRAFATNEYPSLIRGGHNLVTVRISTSPVHAMTRDVDILIALNKETVSIHMNELQSGTLVVFDPKDYAWQQSEFAQDVKLVSVPLSQLTLELGGSQVMRNTVAFGATLALLGTPLDPLIALLTDQFKRKGETVVKQNISVAKAGYDYIQKTYPGETSKHLTAGGKQEKLMIINGSEAVGVAAVRAGLKFAAIYPMTPINSLISYLADHSKEYGVIYKQPEDEVAGMNMAIGASIGGVRSMVATSGGGFDLMTEGLSLAGIVEVPIVIDLGMRVGPATGMPTWTEQGELLYSLFVGHGEFPRIVMAPGDGEEIFQTTIDAFHLADKYQIPVFILTDKYLNESTWCVPASVYSQPVRIDRGKLLRTRDLEGETDYKRYRTDVDDGVSPRSIPGTPNGYYVANSYEHTQVGLVTEDPDERNAMVEKRMRKWRAIETIVKPPVVYGPPSADITFVDWGTSKGPIRTAIDILQTKGISANLIHYTWLYPFPTAATRDLFATSKRIIDVELNSTGQLATLVRLATGITIDEKILKFDGRPFYPEEIVGRVTK